jgi:hypothetical protein
MDKSAKIKVSRRSALQGIVCGGVTMVSSAGLSLIGTAETQAAGPAVPIIAAAIPAVIEWIKPDNIRQLGRYKKLLFQLLMKGVEKFGGGAREVLRAADEITDMILGADFQQKRVKSDKLTGTPDAAHWENISEYRLNNKALEGVLNLPQFSFLMSQLLRANPSGAAVTALNDLNIPEVVHALAFTDRGVVPNEPVVPLRGRRQFTPAESDFWDQIRGNGDMTSPQNLTDLENHLVPVYTRKLHSSTAVGVGFRKKKEEDAKEPAFYWVFGNKAPTPEERTKIFGEMYAKLGS